MRTSRAFTLIELLVVVAIIVALLAILLPSMNRAIEMAHRAVCGSQLAQQHTASLAWAADRSGNLPIGQPTYSFIMSSPTTPAVGIGQYALWYRNMNHSFFVNDYGGKYLKAGGLVKRGYMPDGRTFFCPSWTGVIGYEKTGGVHGADHGGWFEDEADLPAAQVWMQTTYHYNSQFGSTDYTTNWRGPRLIDPPSSALMADAFSDPARAVDQHHVEGYMMLRLGGSAEWVGDAEYRIRNLKGGLSYENGNDGYGIYTPMAWRILEGRE